MRRILFKTLTVMLIILFIMEPVFALGNKENNKTGTTGTSSGSVSSGAPASVTGTPGSTTTSGSVDQNYWLVSNGDGTTTLVEYRNEEIVPPGAIGKKTIKADGELVVDYFDDAESWLGQWIKDIADAIDQVVFRIALAIHPFPTSMFQLYGLSVYQSDLHTVGLKMSPVEDNIHYFDTGYLLISNNYYDSRNLNINRQKAEIDGVSVSTGNSLNEWKLPIAEDENETGEGMFQYTKWKTVVLLFACCFAAEILFMAVYGYATGSSEDGDSSLMKNLAKKIAVTLMLMVLVAALPFLLEAFRIGLFEIAESFYGESAYKSYSELAEQKIVSEADNPVDSNGKLKEKNIFKLPGLFLRSMRDMFARTTSDPMDKALTKQMSKSSADEGVRSLFVKLVVWILITVYRFLMFFITLKATIHIAKNVLEVYLLLSLVMIFVPFSVFTPLKTVGNKCVMSLVSNLIECFIILVIIITIIPAIKVTIVSLLNYAVELTISGTSVIDVIYKQGEAKEVEEHTMKLVTGDGYVVLFAESGPRKDKLAICWAAPGADGAPSSGYDGNEELKTVVKAEGAWAVLDISKMTAADSQKNPILTRENAVAKFIHKPAVLESTKATLALDTQNFCIISGENGEAVYNKQSYAAGLLVYKSDYGETAPAESVVLAEIFAKAIFGSGAFEYDWNPKMEKRNDLTQSIWDLLINSSGEGVFNGADGSLLVSLSKLLNIDTSNPTHLHVGTRSDVKEYASDSSSMSSDDVTAAMFLQLTLVFLGLFLPSFFVQQSTQITNALMNGTAGMESLANAMDQTVSKAVGMTGKFLGMPFSVAGNMADAHMQGRRMQQGTNNANGTAQNAQTQENSRRSTLASVVDTNNKNK